MCIPLHTAHGILVLQPGIKPVPPAVEACSLNHWARRLTIQGFPCSSDGKESPANAGDPALIPGSEKSPGERSGSPLQFLPGKFHQQKSLASYSPWGCKEYDTA